MRQIQPELIQTDQNAFDVEEKSQEHSERRKTIKYTTTIQCNLYISIRL